MSQNPNQFVISKNQILVAKKHLLANGFTQEEVDAMKGSDIALNYKIVNGIIPGPKDATKHAAICTKFAVLIGFNIAEHKTAPKPVSTTEAGSEEIAAGELGTPKEKKKSTKKTELAPEPVEALVPSEFENVV